MRDKKINNTKLAEEIEKLRTEIEGLPELIIFHINCNDLSRARYYSNLLKNHSAEIHEMILKAGHNPPKIEWRKIE